MGAVGRKLALAFVLLTAGLAGCIGTAGEPLEANQRGPLDPATAPLGIEGINESRLTEKVYDVLPKDVTYLEASTPGENLGESVELYVEVHLPDGEGPWPTILESSPYHVLSGNGEADALFGKGRLVDEYVPRGYAVVVAHVRGTGNSEGCMDMMGAKEQADQADLVEWIAEQEWSDGEVAMHGVSYVGTTPHEAAIEDPEHLTTIVTVAGVTNQWRNTFMNGVPYDGRHYPLTYEVLVGAPPPTNAERGSDWARNAASAACGQQEALAHVSPGTYEKGIYDDYWAERNLTRHASNVSVPILYSQGFDDRAVNPSEAIYWFNELDVPRKGLFHQQGHQYPPREDYFTLEHAWLDHWLKGIETGVMSTPPVEVLTNKDTIRVGDTWPPEEATHVRFNLTTDTLTRDTAERAQVTYLADLARNPADVVPSEELPGPAETVYESPTAPAGLPARWTWTTAPLDDPMHIAGPVRMHLNASVDAENTYFLFDVYDEAPDGERTWLTEGWFNAHLREGFDHSAPLTPGQAYRFDFTFEPREWVLEEGHRLVLQVTGHDDRVFPIDEPATRNTIHLGPEGSWIQVPVLEDPVVRERSEDI